MAKIEVVNWKKEKVGQMELDPSVFGVEVKQEVLHAVVRWQLASRRQGTHMTKTKGLVSGGGKKPFKQKGTGNARQGSTRSPLMPGGGTIFGPEPRDYSYVLPKKVKRLALSMSVSHLVKEGRLVVLDNAKSSGKTSELAKNLKTLGFNKAIIVDSSDNKTLARASKNLASYKFLPVTGLNVFDVLKYDHVVLSKESVGELVQRIKGEQ